MKFNNKNDPTISLLFTKCIVQIETVTFMLPTPKGAEGNIFTCLVNLCIILFLLTLSRIDGTPVLQQKYFL